MYTSLIRTPGTKFFSYRMYKQKQSSMDDVEFFGEFTKVLHIEFRLTKVFNKLKILSEHDVYSQ